MRTTLALDEDALEAVRKLAAARRQSIGRVASDLIRKGLEHKPEFDYVNGLPVFKVTAKARKITSEDVRRTEDEAW